jgi:hypothetical protein
MFAGIEVYGYLRNRGNAFFGYEHMDPTRVRGAWRGVKLHGEPLKIVWSQRASRSSYRMFAQTIPENPNEFVG